MDSLIATVAHGVSTRRRCAANSFYREQSGVGVSRFAPAHRQAAVIDGVAGIHRRGVLQRAIAASINQRSTDAFEAARETMRRYEYRERQRRSSSPAAYREASTSSRELDPVFAQAGDEIIVGNLEHHSNTDMANAVPLWSAARFQSSAWAGDGGSTSPRSRRCCRRAPRWSPSFHVGNVTGAILPVDASSSWRTPSAKVLIDG